jgi:hypothetical protein
MTQIRVPRQRYASDEDFFARVPWSLGFRYLRIDVAESDHLPGHRELRPQAFPSTSTSHG